MRALTRFSFVLVGAALLFAVRAGAGDKEATVGWTPELMMNVQQIGSVQASPDGKHVAYTVRRAVLDGDKSEYLTHIHLAGADGSKSRQLTQGDKSCDDPQWSPDGTWIAFISTRSGKKNLWVIDPNGNDSTQLTDVRTGVVSYRWSPDGQALAFVAKEALTLDEIKALRSKNDVRVVDENIKMNRLYVIPFTSPPKLQANARQLTAGPRSVNTWSARAGRAHFDWSPDAKTIVFSHTKTPNADDWPSADLSLVRIADGTITSLAHTPAAETSPFYSPDGKWIALIRSDDPPTWAGKGRIHVIAADASTTKAFVETWDNFGRYSELIGWLPDGQGVYFTEARGTTLALNEWRFDGGIGRISHALGMSQGGVSLNRSRTHFGFGWETLDRPPEAFVASADAFKPQKVSDAQAKLPKLSLGRTEVIHWKGTHGLAIEGLLTYPVGYTQGQSCPLLVIAHGGPMGVFTETFVGSPGPYPVAAFAARGYAILRPNVRGSSGYGAKFRYANYGDWGGGDFQDLMAGVDHVIALGIADPDRLGIMGWSYGGFMTSWAITQTKRFKAASVGAGVTNLMSFTGTADIPSFLPDYFSSEFWDKLDGYRAHSAMFHVKGVITPTLIQHGERDERVPLSQGQELYNALKRQGCVTQMVIYPRTPHGIEEPRLLLDCMNRNLEWFDKYVRKRSVNKR